MANIFSFDAIGALGIVGPRDEAHRARDGGGADLPAAPGRDGAAGAHHAGGVARALRARHRALAPARDRGPARALVRGPARHMREYLEVLGPLLRGEPCDYKGEEYRVAASAAGAGRGARAGPRRGARPEDAGARRPARRRHDHLDDRAEDARATHTVPTLTRGRARRRAGPAPRVVAGLPIALVREPPRRARRGREAFAIYGQLPSYRAMLDREGAAGPADVAIAGDERALEAGAAPAARTRASRTSAPPPSRPSPARRRARPDCSAPPVARASSASAPSGVSGATKRGCSWRRGTRSSTADRRRG